MANQKKEPEPFVWASALVVLLSAILWNGCRASGQRTGATEAPPTPVMVTEVALQDVAIFSDIAAQTYARNMVEVRGRVEGYVDQWLFRPGAEVKAGQVLYVLDLRPYEAAVGQAAGNLHQSEADLEFAKNQVSLLQAQANLAAAQASLLKAQQDVERLTPLVKADAASRQDLDAAAAALTANQANVTALKANVDQAALSTRTQIGSMQAKVEALRAALRTAELNLQYGTIRAPIDGRIGDSLVPVGGLVTPSSPQALTTIVPLDPIWVRFKVTELEYASWANHGQAVPGGNFPLTLMLADQSECPVTGRIENALNQVDPKTGTLELQARFPNPKHAILPGQFGRVRMQVAERKDAILVPQKAVQQLQSMQAVYTVGPDNKVLQRAVTTGERVGTSWIVEQGLKPGDRVVVEGQLKVRPGMRVQPQPYRAPDNTPPPERQGGN
ncbi:MAG: efflux RND transporter periplasmic adaptor subunit [Acidobacteriia bacterium]|nr:efflux RND transporter periplasmic adaptor subunit [Terriglobia bacterium]